ARFGRGFVLHQPEVEELRHAAHPSQPGQRTKERGRARPTWPFQVGLEGDTPTDRLVRGRLALEQRVGGVPRHFPKPTLAAVGARRTTTPPPPPLAYLHSHATSAPP